LHNKDEVLYVSDSKALIKHLKRLNLEVLYDPVLNANKANGLLLLNNSFIERLKQAKNLIVAYCLKEEKSCDSTMCDVILEGTENFKLHARDLVIYPFLSTHKSPSINISHKVLPTETSNEHIRILTQSL